MAFPPMKKPGKSMKQMFESSKADNDKGVKENSKADKKRDAKELPAFMKAKKK